MKPIICRTGTFLLLLFLSCSKEEQHSVQKDSQIIFISQRAENSANWYLFKMKADGTEQTQITGLTVRCEKPSVSHNGNTVAFVHMTADNNFELYFINTDGTNPELIDNSKQYLGMIDWSADDKKIVYARSRDDLSSDKDIVVFNRITFQKSKLTSSGDNVSPKFTPEDKILYCQQNNSVSTIYSMNSDGSAKQLLIAEAGNPVLSPDGRKIAYIATGAKRSPQIFVADADGNHSFQLTTAYLQCWDSGFPDFGNYNPQWTPDGNSIVYESEINDGTPEIYRMNKDGSNQRRLTDTERRNESPAISSDGQFILFSSNRNMRYNSDIFIMDPDGRNQHSLSNYSGNDCYPVLILNKYE